MGGYPPGMSKRDFIRAGIDNPHDHQHEFREEDTDLIIEDGAACFSVECYYETREGYNCEERLRYRFEYDSLITASGIRIDLHPIESWNENPPMIQEWVISIEEKWQNGAEIDVYPDRDDGYVELTHDEWTLRYKP